MQFKLIDTHCHLDFRDFDKDRDKVIKRAYEGGVKKMINIGCDLEQAKKSIEIAKKHDFIFAACGLHPQEADKGNEKFFEELRKLLKEPKVVAIGECGLEYFGEHNNPESREKQKEVFLKHLVLAKEFKKPAIIHCRNAYSEILEILKKEKEKNSELSGVVHCFVGRLAQAEEFLKLDFSISFTGIITYARDYDKVIKNIPIEKIMVETDAPFVSPLPYRGKRCEPLYVKYVAEKIAELKGLSFEKVAQTTTENAETFLKFDII
jgi:TatD DNase family protein